MSEELRATMTDEMTVVQFVERLAGHYADDAIERPHADTRRRAQIIALHEVLAFMRGQTRVADQLRQRATMPLLSGSIEAIARGGEWEAFR